MGRLSFPFGDGFWSGGEGSLTDFVEIGVW
jgi:hypothetical protein